MAQEGYHRSALIKYISCCLLASAIYTTPAATHQISATTASAAPQTQDDAKHISLKIDILILYMSALINISIGATQLTETAPPLYNTATSGNPPLYSASTYWIDFSLSDLVGHIYDQPWVYYDLASDVALTLPSYYHVLSPAYITRKNNNDSTNDNHSSNSNRIEVMSKDDTELLNSLNRLVITIKKAYTLERLHL